ncbi:hypothetical protein LJK88_35915 [Paenibacillus sp. P26]|nr:hypothetical protein LJK88_35915 [Paenibacillus sp. P26]UUZ93605.1 hypothetical protein LJK87_02315 [Paenibacillus sp. P25]
MEKMTYYVSVQSRTIMLHQGDAAYELEIEATPDEIRELQELFEDKEDFELDTFSRAHYLATEYHHDRSNDGYDMVLKDIYQKLYALGTDETKRHIESMNILQ